MNFDERVFRTFLTAIRPFKNKGLGNIKPVNSLYRKIEGKLLPTMRRVVHVNDYDLQLEAKSIDGIERQLIFNNEYEPVTTSILKKYVRSGMKVIDVGANIGYFTLLLSKLVDITGTVTAFEPERNNFRALLNNIRLNNVGNIQAIQNAVGNNHEMLSLYISSEESGEHSLIAKRHCKSEQQIEVVRLDDVVKDTNVIKTDTEGNDFHVLQGAERLLTSHPLLIIEFWPEGILKSGHTHKEFWDLLHVYYKDIFIADEVEKTLTIGTLEDALRRCQRNKLSVNLIGGFNV
jgi:FkbM family methyltransferase